MEDASIVDDDLEGGGDGLFCSVTLRNCFCSSAYAARTASRSTLSSASLSTSRLEAFSFDLLLAFADLFGLFGDHSRFLLGGL